jgi:FkbM family methyltransferase
MRLEDLSDRLGNYVRRLLSRSDRAYRAARWLHGFVRFLRKRPHDPNFAAFALFRDRHGLFLDVGANMGQSALSFRIFHDAPILSIEPNPDHRTDLRLCKRVLKRFDFLTVAAGEENGTATLRIPTFRGAGVTGEASLIDDDRLGEYWASRHLHGATSQLGVRERQVEVRRLDELGLDPSFVKLDVEGFEVGALRGLRATIERSRPIMLIEHSGSFSEVREFLTAMDYEPFAFDPLRGRLEPFESQQVGNVFFVQPGDI